MPWIPHLLICHNLCVVVWWKEVERSGQPGVNFAALPYLTLGLCSELNLTWSAGFLCTVAFYDRRRLGCAAVCSGNNVEAEQPRGTEGAMVRDHE